MGSGSGLRREVVPCLPSKATGSAVTEPQAERVTGQAQGHDRPSSRRRKWGGLWWAGQCPNSCTPRDHAPEPRELCSGPPGPRGSLGAGAERVGERAGGSPGLGAGSSLGKAATGRGRDEPAQATARPQECAAQQRQPCPGRGARGADKGDPPAWKPPSSHPSWHGLPPPSPPSPNLLRVGSTPPTTGVRGG